MVTGGFVDAGCPVVWEDYPYGARGKDRYGRPIGRLVCLVHESLVAFGVAKGEDIGQTLCPEEIDDETEPTDEVE